MSDPAKTTARLAAEKIAISFASWQRGKLADDIERAILDAEKPLRERIEELERQVDIAIRAGWEGK